MDIFFALKLLMVVATLLFGVVSLIFPKRIAETIGLNVDNPMGLAEIRTGWGGLYIALGLGALFLRFSPAVFVLLAFAYGGMAITRTIQAILKPSLVNRMFFGVLAFEVLSAVIFLLQYV